MNINPFNIIYYYHPDKVGGPADKLDESPFPRKTSLWWKMMDWTAEIMILAGIQLHHACRSHLRINPTPHGMNDRPVSLS